MLLFFPYYGSIQHRTFVELIAHMQLLDTVHYKWCKMVMDNSNGLSWFNAVLFDCGPKKKGYSCLTQLNTLTELIIYRSMFSFL